MNFIGNRDFVKNIRRYGASRRYRFDIAADQASVVVLITREDGTVLRLHAAKDSARRLAGELKNACDGANYGTPEVFRGEADKHGGPRC